MKKLFVFAFALSFATTGLQAQEVKSCCKKDKKTEQAACCKKDKGSKTDSSSHKHGDKKHDCCQKKTKDAKTVKL